MLSLNSVNGAFTIKVFSICFVFIGFAEKAVISFLRGVYKKKKITFPSDRHVPVVFVSIKYISLIRNT